MKKEYRLPDEKRGDLLPLWMSSFLYIYLILHLSLLALKHSTIWVFLAIPCYSLLRQFEKAIQGYYVIIEADKLSIRNRQISSWGGEYRYRDIEEVRLKGGKQLSFPFLQVRLKNGKRSRNFSISALVDPARYQELVDDLRERGVKVSLNKMKGVI